VTPNIQPKTNPVCYVDVSTGRKFITRSTVRSDRKEKIDGVEYTMVLRDVTMDSHPVYTGEKRFVDTAGRVDKFNKKFTRRRA